MPAPMIMVRGGRGAPLGLDGRSAAAVVDGGSFDDVGLAGDDDDGVVPVIIFLCSL